MLAHQEVATPPFQQLGRGHCASRKGVDSLPLPLPLAEAEMGARVTGGRYDGLLKAMWPKTMAPMGAVGITVAADGLVARVAAAHSRSEAEGPAVSQVLDASARLRGA